MKKIFFVICALVLVNGCSKFEVSQDTGLIDLTLVAAPDRISKVMQSVTVNRSSGSSSSFSTTLPNYINIASVIAPSAASSTGDVQATSVRIKNNIAYVSYNMSGEEIFGAIDLIDVSNPNNPVILYSYSTSEYEFSDLRLKGDYLYLSGVKKNKQSFSQGAILMAVKIDDPAHPLVTKILDVQGIYATSMDLVDDKLTVMSGTLGGISTYNVQDPSNPTLIDFDQKSNGLYVSTSYSQTYSLSGQSSTVLEAKSDFANGIGVYTVAPSASEAPSRFVRQNSLLYINNSRSNKLDTIDISHSLLSSRPMTLIGRTSLIGTSNGIAFDQQKLYLAQGEKGFFIADVSNPAAPQILGNFDFQNDNGSANNVWIEKTLNAKYYFLADGRQGLRILTESLPLLPSSNEVTIYARGMDYQGSANVSLRINGIPVHTWILNDTQFQTYTYNYSRPLTNSDLVEVLFTNDLWNNSNDEDRNAFIAYLKSNNTYCYQKALSASYDDLGLFQSNQTIAMTGTDCQTSTAPSAGTICSPNTLKQPIQSCTLPNNHSGSLACNVSGTAFDQCLDSGQCISGFTEVNGICQPNICSPGSVADCSDSTTVRQKICDSTGTAYGSCNPVSCQPGYSNSNGSCVAQMCTPGSSTSCSVANGSGTKTCSSDGLSYGPCNVTSCNAGYYNNNGTCVAQTCAPNSASPCVFLNMNGTKTCSPNGSGYGVCVTNNTCVSGYALVAGLCVAQTCTPGNIQNCAITNGSGTQTCDLSGLSYGSCSVSSCNSGYYQSGNTCVAQSCTPNSAQSCTVNNFQGTKTCAANGSAYGSCVPGNTCVSGYYNNNGTCVPQVCSPNSTQQCSNNNLLGTQTCAPDGSGFGSCVTGTTCASGYYYNNGSCVAQSCSPGSTTSCAENNGSGTKTCNAQGSGYGSCQLTSCNSGFYQSGNTCVANICSPNSNTSCVSNHLIGTKTCNVQGSAYGSCVTGSTCESGYYYSNGSCIAQSCSPNSVTSCSVSNGVGTQQCNTQGSAYSSCQLSSCNPGYYNNGGSCVAQSCSPNSTQSCTVNNFQGTQTCTSNGSGFGSCVASTTCVSGYYYNNGSCVAQVCSPNSTASCSSANGTGIKTCNTQGSAYGSCQLSACNSGYTLQGGSCVAQVCSPNSTASCSSGNGYGTKTCSSDGLSYGSCQLSGCNSGYIFQGGSCVQNSCSIPNGTGTTVQTNNVAGISVTHQLNNDWGAGYTYQLSILNNSSSQIQDWAVCFYYDYEVGNSNISNTVIDSSSAKPNWKFTPMSYNGIIYPGSNVTINWNGSPGNVGTNRLSSVRLLNNRSASCSNLSGSTVLWSDSAICQVSSCNSGYHAENNACVSDTKSCSVSNGTGVQTWNGSSYGSCQAVSCNSGYSVQNGACVQTVSCTPHSKAPCLVSNGSGTKTCSSNGAGYSSCSASSCSSGYKNKSGACMSICPNPLLVSLQVDPLWVCV